MKKSEQLSKLRLITNNPEKRAGLEGYGLQVMERIPVHAVPNEHNVRYLETQRTKMGRRPPAIIRARTSGCERNPRHDDGVDG